LRLNIEHDNWIDNYIVKINHHEDKEAGQ